MILFFKVHLSHQTTSPCCASNTCFESRAFRFYFRLLVCCNSIGFLLTMQNLTAVLGRGELVSSVWKLHGDTNWSSCRRWCATCLHSSWQWNHTQMPVQNIHRELRACCNLTVHRHYTWGLEMSESKNITCTIELPAKAAWTKWSFPVLLPCPSSLQRLIQPLMHTYRKSLPYLN